VIAGLGGCIDWNGRGRTVQRMERNSLCHPTQQEAAAARLLLSEDDDMPSHGRTSWPNASALLSDFYPYFFPLYPVNHRKFGDRT
jgi:hypothetical protein